MNIDKNEISKQLKELFKAKKCNFYKGSKQVKVEHILAQAEFDYKEGEYYNHYNYEVRGKGEFMVLDSITGDLKSNGIECFSTLIQVDDNKIKSIDRINIKQEAF